MITETVLSEYQWYRFVCMLFRCQEMQAHFTTKHVPLHGLGVFLLVLIALAKFWRLENCIAEQHQS